MNILKPLVSLVLIANGKIKYWRKIYAFRKQERSLRKNYSNKNPKRHRKAVIFMLDEHLPKGGLVDKLKGIVSARALADFLGFEFKIFINEESTTIQHYLLVKLGVLVLDKEQLSYNRSEASAFFWYNYMPKNVNAMLRKVKPYNELHVYCNLDLLGLLGSSKVPRTLNIWGSLFKDIFKPSDDIINEVATLHSSFLGEPLGFHLRFMNLLGDFEESGGSNYSLKEVDRQKLIDDCLFSIGKILRQRGCINSILFVSDSPSFLSAVRQDNFLNTLGIDIYVDSTNIAHTGLNKNREIMRKTILDFFLLAGCKEIYQIKVREMHRSDFSKYAAKVEDSRFQVIVS